MESKAVRVECPPAVEQRTIVTAKGTRTAHLHSDRTRWRCTELLLALRHGSLPCEITGAHISLQCICNLLPRGERANAKLLQRSQQSWPALTIEA